MRVMITVAALVAWATVGHAQSGASYTTLFYTIGTLRLEAYLYKPARAGRVPLIVYNHGNRGGGLERTEQPHVEISNLFVSAGYAVLVPERRGFGKSDGPTYTEETKGDPSAAVRRADHEADDVLAAVDFVKTQPFIDSRRIGMVGYSLGGQVSVFAASRSDVFRVIVNQAGGSLAWDSNPDLRRVLPERARAIKVPTFCAVAANDATTVAVESVCNAARERGTMTETKIYAPYSPPGSTATTPPAGHQLFQPPGIPIWGKDALAFLSRYLNAQT